MGGYERSPDLARALAQMDARISALERTQRVTVITGQPATTPAEGSMLARADTPRLYLRVAGTWRSVALT